MKGKQFVPAVAGLLLVCVIFLAGCPVDADNGSSADKWSRVQSASEIYGTWEGDMVIDVPPIPLALLLLSDPEFELPPGIPPNLIPDTLPASSVDYKVQMTILANLTAAKVTVDFNRYLDETVGPLLKPLVWLMAQNIMDEFLGSPEFMGSDFTIVPQDDCTAIIEFETTDEMQFDDETELYINKNKTKLKLLVETEGPPQEIILHRKS